MKIKLAIAITLLAAGAAVCHGGGVVKSVEHVEVALANGVYSNSVNLTKSQVTANCVPFVTENVATNNSGNCDLDDWFIDVYFEAGPKVTIQRTGNAGSVTAGISVVEFASDAVKIVLTTS